MSCLDASPSGGLLMILSAPSGCGKSTLAACLLDRRDDLAVSISHTTRAPRGSEEDGVAYHFIDKQSFEARIAEGGFVEHATVYDEYYGTSHAEIARIHGEGRHALLDIDTQGGRQVMTAYPDALSVFILPPSMEELERRLRSRGTDSEEKIRMRVSRARDEIHAASSYTHVIVNDDLEVAVEELLSILQAAERRSEGMSPAVAALLEE